MRGDPEKLPLLETEAPVVDVAEMKKRHREQYAIEQEEREIDEGIRDNPSLDVETQKAIIMDYRKLHEQIKAEGLYQCRYSAYAWESVRYAGLFAAFAYLLYCKWYLTSAIFLGLFWVSHTFCRRGVGNVGCNACGVSRQHDNGPWVLLRKCHEASALTRY